MYCEKCGKYSGKYNLCKECYYSQDETEEADETKEAKTTNEEISEENELICPICGSPTRIFYGNARKDRLCGIHADMLKAGTIFLDSHGRYREKETNNIISKNNQSKKWTYVNSSCKICGQFCGTKEICDDCKQKQEDETKVITNDIEKEENTVITINENNKSRCITCGKKTDGLLFCASCYHKYGNKELLFKITNCTSVELLDENYEGRYTCKDGHIVKSKSERDIDNYLFEHGIPHAYEKALPYGAAAKEVLHPDFYLPHYLGEGKHVYIEHWGYNENNLHYTKTKVFKISKYKELGITLVCTNEKTDSGDIDTILEQKLNKRFIKENQINFEN